MGVIAIIILVAILNLVLISTLPAIGQSVVGLSSDAFNVVGFLDSKLNTNLSSGLSSVITSVAVSLLCLGFLKKGFETYIAYTDGDPDSNPLQLLTLFCKAIAILFGFDAIYNWMTVIIQNICAQALSTIRISTNTDWTSFTNSFLCGDDGANLLGGILALIFAVLYFITYFSVIKSGVEIFVLKIGMPLACIGLLNADKGIFKNYMMSFTKAFVTILVKIILLQIGFSVITVSSASGGTNGADFFTNCFGLIVGIACTSLSLSTPKLLAEFMIPSSGGGNFSSKAYYAINMLRKVK